VLRRLAVLVGQGARFAIASVVVGCVVAVVASRWMEPLLFQQSARDAAAYLAVALLLVVVALTATAWPAMRGDHNTALRVE
jgi:putative ABC transport system permease protein